MSDMSNPFTWFMWIGVLGYWWIIGSIFIAGVFISVIYAKRKRWDVAAIGVLVALSPALLYNFRVAYAERQMSNRIAEVAAMHRSKLPPDYPRFLEVEGSIDDRMVTALMVLSRFDQVAASDHLFVRPIRDEYCLTAAETLFGLSNRHNVEWLEDLPERLENCVTVENRFDLDNLKADAVVLRLGRSTKLRKKSGARANDSIEIQLRRRGREQLIEYREQTIVSRPVSLWLPTSNSIDSIRFLDKRAILSELFITGKQ